MKLVPTFFCPKPWASMPGDQVTRFCELCGKHVHNVDALTLDQRLAILRSNSGFCGRYRVAVRRARPGASQSYMQHLLKYGAGVTAASGVFLILWQLCAGTETDHKQTYRVVVPQNVNRAIMPPEMYEEHEVFLLGMITVPEPVEMSPARPEPLESPPAHIDMQIDTPELKIPIHS